MVRPTASIHPGRYETGEIAHYEFDVRYSGDRRRNVLFYEVARDLAPPPADNFDGNLCAIVLYAMAEGRDIRLHPRGATSTTKSVQRRSARHRRARP